MSYILDALKKAESERALGSVPGIHAQQAPLIAAGPRQPAWLRPVLWTAVAAAAVLAALFWLQPWQSRGEAPAAAAQRPTPAPAVSVPAPVAVPAPPAPAAPAPEVPVAAKADPAPAPVAKKPEAAEPAKSKAPPKAAVVKSREPAPPAAKAPDPLATAVKPADPIPSAEPHIPALRELPEHVRRDIPAVAIGGYIYAAKAAERSALINNRLVREGEQISPGLVLEKMLPREAVLSYRGTRYRVPYN